MVKFYMAIFSLMILRNVVISYIKFQQSYFSPYLSHLFCISTCTGNNNMICHILGITKRKCGWRSKWKNMRRLEDNKDCHICGTVLFQGWIRLFLYVTENIKLHKAEIAYFTEHLSLSQFFCFCFCFFFFGVFFGGVHVVHLFLVLSVTSVLFLSCLAYFSQFATAFRFPISLDIGYPIVIYALS